MTFKVQFFVPGAPIPKGRPRFRRVKTAGGADFISTYTPQKTRNFERDVRLIAKQSLGFREPATGPIRLELVAVMPIPASWTKKKQAQARAGLLYPITRPDLDNIEKAVTDACNAVLYADDSQIVEVVKAKRYGDTPQVWVNIEAI